jgi:hypothetical protein
VSPVAQFQWRTANGSFFFSNVSVPELALIFLKLGVNIVPLMQSQLNNFSCLFLTV